MGDPRGIPQRCRASPDFGLDHLRVDLEDPDAGTGWRADAVGGSCRPYHKSDSGTDTSWRCSGEHECPRGVPACARGPARVGGSRRGGDNNQIYGLAHRRPDCVIRDDRAHHPGCVDIGEGVGGHPSRERPETHRFVSGEDAARGDTRNRIRSRSSHLVRESPNGGDERARDRAGCLSSAARSRARARCDDAVRDRARHSADRAERDGRQGSAPPRLKGAQ